MPEQDELAQGGEEKQKKGGLNIMGLLISVVIAAVVAGGVSFVLVKFVLGTNTPSSSSETTQPTIPVEIRVRFVVEGSNKTFMLKGGRTVIVIDMLSFNVGSDGCRAEIANRNDQILSALQDLFIQKEEAELATAAGLDLLKRQIRDLVNRVTNYVGDRAKYGVIEVFMYIKAITSVQ
ncbi:MAG TPA: flagellar basal body protein FliL [Thermotogota bacterium]|nr:flagellar basal body protein FliL [Thermotogota bacterium]HRW92664.1 flagellar basal body protein FliL [Thermotogota bacterium]